MNVSEPNGSTASQAEASPTPEPRVVPALASWQPPISHLDLAACEGRIGSELTDFRVEELGLYPLSGQGEHCWVRVEKRGVTTNEMQQIVAHAAGVSERDVGVAGMKDKHAVTSQWLSFLAARARPVESWILPESVTVLESTRHGNKLRTGHLAGNRFVIRLVEVTAPEHANAMVERLKSQGVPNYFGAQRFGRDGNNLSQAINWLNNPKQRGTRFQEKLYSSVIQSEVFNRVAGQRAATMGRLFLGDVVRLNGSTRHFIVEDPEKEQPRLDSGDIFLTGPIVGPKMLKARADVAAREGAVLDELGLSEDALERLGTHAPGTRRDMRVVPGELSCTLLSASELELSFTLDAGSYATQIIREFTRSPFGQDGRRVVSERREA